MTDMDLEELERKMQGSFDVLSKEFTGLRTGRASTGLLDSVVVEVYGSKMPLSQVASVSAPEPRLLTVQVWDTNNTKAVEKAITNAGLGLNPQPMGSLIRVPLPGLTEERRVELVKVASKYTEQARIAVRNIRREGMESVKKSKMSEDDLKKAEDKVQKLTDVWVGKIDDAFAHKEQEIRQV